MMMIAGRRLVRASETDENQKISAAKVKGITGGNKQNARGLFIGDEENIESTWSLILETNDIPIGLTKDFALMQRLIIIEFPWLFVENIEEESQKEPHNAHRFRLKDKRLYDTLQDERPGILLDLIRCCLLWQAAKGINPPERLKVRLEEQKTKEDTLLQFLHSRCLMDWEQLRTYEEGQVCNIPGETVGEQYRCMSTSKNQHPHQHSEGEGAVWHYEGPGLLPDQPVIFAEFYAVFKKWYSDEISDSEKYRPSKKAVTKQLRDKGLDVRSKGAGTRIWRGLEVVTITE
jgi:phage/plasmid-associated DNA primase